MAARLVFVVITAARAVLSRPLLYGSAWMTRTGGDTHAVAAPAAVSARETVSAMAESAPHY